MRFTVAVTLASLVACGSVPGAPGVLPSGAAPPRAAFLVSPARWFPSGQPAEVRFRRDEWDGRRQVVELGLRYVSHPDGRIERARDLLPSGGTLGVIELPDRLGGGFLFRLVSEGSTDVYRAAEFTGGLTPLIRLPFEASDLVPGFDRLYASSGRTKAVVAVHPKSGEVIGVGPLPPSPAYGAMAFSGSWLAAVETDVRGALVTFDAGASWHRLGVPLTPPGVLTQGGRIVLATTRGGFLLDPSGEIERVDGASPDPGDLGAFLSLDPGGDSLGDEVEDDVTPSAPAGALGAPPLEVAVLRGLPDSPRTAVVAAGGALGRVNLADGSLLNVVPNVLPPGAACQVVPLGSGMGLVCGEDRGGTTVQTVSPRLELAPLLAFDGARRVSSSDNGRLVVRGGCSEGAGHVDAAYCIVDGRSAPWDIRVQGDVGVERVIALSDGAVVVLAPPRFGLSATLTVIGPGDGARSVELSFASVPKETRELLQRALWLDGMIEIAPLVLGGWAASGTAFVGFKVALDGKVQAGTVRTGAERTSFSGRFAFSFGEQGGGYETTDGGMTWAEVPLPSPALEAQTAERERGCSRTGCAVGAWIRVGWGSDNAFAPPPNPPPAKLDTQFFSAWSFDCVPTGKSEGPRNVAVAAHRPPVRATLPARALPVREARPNVVIESSAWRTFLGAAGPQRGDDLGFDFGTEDHDVQLRGYVWGARTAPWDRTGSWLVRVADRFSVERAVWSTAPSRPPWPDAASAAEAFGGDPSHRVPSEWTGLLDPSGESGALVLRTGSVTELAIIERDRAIMVVRNAGEFSLERLVGVAKVNGRWYLGAIPSQRTLQLLSVDGGTLSLVASYPRYADDAPAQLVRTSRGDAVGLWLIQKGHQGTGGGGDTWFVYPLDPVTGEPGDPLEIPRQSLSRAPRVCGLEEEGWVLPFLVNPTVAKVDFSHVSETPSIERLEARLLASARGLCVESLAARVDGDPPGALRPVGMAERAREGASLALTDRATDRRWEFRCTP